MLYRMRVRRRREDRQGAPGASDTAVWTWPPVIAADAGRYANSIVGKSGVEVRGDGGSESQTRHHALRSWLLRKSISKSVVEEAERRNLFGGEAEKSGAF